jgi:hypothetical protein
VTTISEGTLPIEVAESSDSSSVSDLDMIRALKPEDLGRLISSFVAFLKESDGSHGVAQQRLSWVDKQGKGHVQESHTVFKREACPRRKGGKRRGGCRRG